jgi:hypothetical protein
MSRAALPEASINNDRYMQFGEHEIKNYSGFLVGFVALSSLHPLSHTI